MIEAHKVSAWKGRYDIVADGRPVATWDKSAWTSGGRLEIDGRPHDVRANLWQGDWAMTDAAGSVVARATGVGRKTWTVEADRLTYEFRRGSWWRYEVELLAAGAAVGSVRRPKVWRSDAVADLPGVPLDVGSSRWPSCWPSGTTSPPQLAEPCPCAPFRDRPARPGPAQKHFHRRATA